MSFIAELKRRNVIRTAVAYLAAAWLLIQVFESLLPAFGFPDTAMRYVFAVLGIGFILVLFAAWVFELTPDGLIRDGGKSARVDPAANRRFDSIIITILVLAVTLFAAHTFIFDPARDAARIAEAAHDARTGAFKESFGDKSIAVLPFRNMSPDPDQEFFGDGIAEELLNLLTKVEGLRVISRTSSFQFKDSDLSLAKIAAELDVAHILEGSVRLSGNKLRITAQLIDAHADAHLWSETYDKQIDDVFVIQDDVAEQVVEQLKVALAVGSPTAARHNPEVYPLYLQAKQIVDLDDPDLVRRAEQLLLRVLEIEPDYVDAKLKLIEAYHQIAWKAQHDGDDALAENYIAKRGRMFQDVQTEHPDNLTVNFMLGWEAMRGSDLSAAARHFEIAINAEPRNYGALLSAANLLKVLGRTDIAIKTGEYLTRRDPMGFWAHGNLGEAYLENGQIDEAVASYRTAAAISPRAVAIQWKLGIALLISGDAQAALAKFELEEHLAYQLHGQALALHDLGDHEGSAAALAQLLKLKNNPDDPENRWDFGLARAYAWLGDADNAFKYLYLMNGSGSAQLFGFAKNPYFLKIRSDPRWQLLVDSVGKKASRIQFNPKLPPEILAIQ